MPTLQRRCSPGTPPRGVHSLAGGVLLLALRALDEAARQWVMIVGGTLVGIHGTDVGDLSRGLDRSEGPK
eukprot:3261571-Pyramimonas_sp.AAC.1